MKKRQSADQIAGLFGGLISQVDTPFLPPVVIGRPVATSFATERAGIDATLLGVCLATMPTSPHHTAAIPPADCERILFVGAGGFGREAVAWARDAWPEHVGRFAGFLSDDSSRLDGHACGLSIVGSPASYAPSPADALVLAIGIPGVRRRVAESLAAKGCRFLTLIHPTAIVTATAHIGPGSILCPYSIASDSARLGRFTLLNYHASIAHDGSTGDFAVLSPYAALAGGTKIADDTFLGLHASVGPGVSIGPRSKVTANSCALNDAPADSLIHGVPGRITPLLASNP